MPRAHWLSVAVLLGAFLGTLAPAPGVAQDFDIVIRGGRVLDGSGNPAFNADVGIRAMRLCAWETCRTLPLGG